MGQSKSIWVNTPTPMEKRTTSSGVTFTGKYVRIYKAGDKKNDVKKSGKEL